MKLLKLAFASLLVIVFISCQKEVDWDAAGPNAPGSGPQASATGITGGSNGTVLLRAVRKSGTDSVVASLEYNSADKFTKYIAVGREKFDTLYINYDIFRRYERDANNRVTKYVSANNLDPIFGALDSTEAYVHYPSASSTEFDYIVKKTDLILFISTDSTRYTYSNGRVVSSITYNSNDFIPGPPTLTSKAEYTYDAAGNVTEYKIYAPDQVTGQLKLAVKTNMTFDNKPNVHYFKNEGFLIGDQYYGPNNTLTAVQVNYNVSPAVTNRISFAYNYNQQSHPMNGQMAANNPDRKFTLTYYYR